MMKLIPILVLLISVVMMGCNDADTNSEVPALEKTYYPSGKLLSIKEYSKDGKNWRTVKFFENGDTSSIAHYHNWKYAGEAIIFFPNGQKNFQQNYDSSGQSDGMYYLWNMDGRLKETGQFVHGKREGTFKTFFDNGQPETDIHYADDKKNGLAVWYNEKGDTIKVKHFINDSLQ